GGCTTPPPSLLITPVRALTSTSRSITYAASLPENSFGARSPDRALGTPKTDLRAPKSTSTSCTTSSTANTAAPKPPQNRVCRAGRSPIHPERSTVDREEVLHAACPGVPPAPGRSVVGLLSHDPPRAPARTSRNAGCSTAARVNHR